MHFRDKDDNILSRPLTSRGEYPEEIKTDKDIIVDDKDLRKIEEVFKHHIGILSEDFQHKLDLVVEGQQMLGERMDRMEGRLDKVEQRLDRVETKVDVLDAKVNSLEKKVNTLETKIDAVAADLSAHRKDTEAHGTV